MRLNNENLAYYPWVFATLNRDNYKCVDCGFAEKEKLLVHHIDESRKTGVLNNSPDNLVTLCRGCHAKRHGLDKSELREDVLELREAGLTFQQIADRFGISRQRAHQHYKKAKNHHLTNV